MDHHRPPPAGHEPGRPAAFRSRSSLAFRLALAINLTAALVLATFWIVDYRRERDLHMAEQIQRLQEAARVLRVGQEKLNDDAAFQAYVDAFCEQMERHISPGHHIIVLGKEAGIAARAHTHLNDALEDEMSQTPVEGWRRFQHDSQPYMAVGLSGVGGTLIIVSQSLAPVQHMIYRQAASRAISVGVLMAILLVTINLLLIRWVRRPIHRLMDGVQRIGTGGLNHRIPGCGASEFQILADGFNRMAESLEQVDRRRRAEMDKARRIHLGLLPPDDVPIPGAAWAAHYAPAETIGGDYHDILTCPDGRRLIVVADVLGHGVPAALIAAMVKALLRQIVAHTSDLAELARALNRELAGLTGHDHFVTFLAVLYSPAGQELEYVNCGHEPGLVVSPDGRSKARLDVAGLPLGILPEGDWRSGRVRLAPGDRLYLWTDGLVEIPGPDDQLYGRHRLQESLTAIRDTAARAAVDGMMAELDRFNGGGAFQDDVTLVTLWRDGESVPSRNA